MRRTSRLLLQPRTLKTGFNSLDPEEREECFALSCYDIGDWEEGFDWLSQESSVRDDINQYLEKLTPNTLWKKVYRDPGELSKAQDLFLTGEASNYFVAWYLEDVFDKIKARTESQNSKSQFDVTLSQRNVDTVGIEMKRVANSNQLTSYFRKFPEVCNKRPDTKYKLLIIYYPVNQTAAKRAPSLVRGYGPLSAMTDSFYTPESVFVANLPASYPRKGSEIQPLRETRNIIQSKTDADT